MSLQLDWEALKPFISQKISEAINNVPMDANPMLSSGVKLVFLDLGSVPPTIAITRIVSLSMKEQKINAMFRYKGDMKLEVKVDLNVNALDAREDHHEGMRSMGMVFTSVPLTIPCRFLVSNFEVLFKVAVTHGEKTFFKFEEPPVVSIQIDSNLSKLGPIFESATKRIEKIAKKAYASFPEEIEIPVPQHN